MPRYVGKLVGHTECLLCRDLNAEVRRDRRGHLYLRCIICKPATVLLTHGYPSKEAHLLSRTRRAVPVIA